MESRKILQALRDVSIATACWLTLSVSLGWYYVITYFGAIGWPMPSVETLGALVLYYFSVINAATEIQAVHWLVVFPLAGFIWAALLRVFVVSEPNAPGVSKIAMKLALTCLPLCLPMPYLMYLAGQTPTGWHVQRMIDVALRRGNLSTWWWLSPMYLALGIAAFALHVRALRGLFPQPALTLVRRALLSGVVFVVVVATVGALASYPLRASFE